MPDAIPEKCTCFELLKLLVAHSQEHVSPPTRQELSTLLDAKLGSGAADLLLNQRSVLDLLDELTLGQVMDLISLKEKADLSAALREADTEGVST